MLAAIGIAAGLALAYASGRAMEALLAGVKPGDPATFLSAIALCLLMTWLGVSYLRCALFVLIHCRRFGPPM